MSEASSVPRTAPLRTASPAMLTAVLDQSLDCIKVIDGEGRLSFMNSNGMCAMEIDSFADVSGAEWASLWPEEARGAIEAGLGKARAGGTTRFEAFCPTAMGTPKWWDVSVSPLIAQDGDPFIVVTSRDITDRVNAAAIREAVTDEMRHRLRNSYAVAGGLLTAHARGDDTLRRFAGDMLARFSALGVAQAAQTEKNTPAELGSIVQELARSYATPACPIVFEDLPQVTLDQRTIDAVALVVGELAVNSIKHGALGHGGAITIGGAMDGDVVKLRWSERADKPVERTERAGGQGFRLMTRVLAPLGGHVETVWADTGPDVTVAFRVPG